MTTMDVRGRIVRKVVLTLFTSLIAYSVTNLTAQPDIYAVMLGAFVGGVTLVVDFLVEFDNRLKAVEKGQMEVEDGLTHHGDSTNALVRDRFNAVERMVEEKFSKINEATALFGLVEASAVRTDLVTQLVRHSTQIDSSFPPIVYEFAQSEIERMTAFLKELGAGADVTYDGEDRDWLLGLARTARISIDATSLTTVDAGGARYTDGGLWWSDLGQRYLEAQRDAIRRNVAVRRVFIVDQPHLASDSSLRQVCARQEEIGIQVRILDPSTNPRLRKSSLFDFVLFDKEISYETTPASRIEGDSRPTIVNTRLVRRPGRVSDLIRQFEELWAAADEVI
ncbi:phosphatidylserine/phosphatidylglycerophosphate/cardiolipin synthase family protein [Phytohabitans sp. ZYX-F-186]|uniref:Phosphatidylserine/phosphatidylglycerophosphate/ cardiolipin synthase family protein n=1 Tax=Phytohabitans maris TaxID=3071409 RepID=A0ABU0ZB38_9ACTN|nr:DUF6879 family protein [Phytohabitans sp. ZYX-F-186]MDQ7904276.1 phosphatidylserine/phosphatidylglycerophosphate/cardiolipin synthase family protein [Phytohabitans sp. ZYX-F-186]